MSNNIMVFSFMVLLCINIIVLQKQMNWLTDENTVMKEHLRQVEYASVYMGQANGAFPINSEKITLIGDHSHPGRYTFIEYYKNIQYFYNLKVLEIDWWLLDVTPYINGPVEDYINGNLAYIPINNNVKKIILKQVDHNSYQKKIFESFPNLEELEININGGFGGVLFDTTKYCNPSTKLKKIVFNQNNKINIDFTGSNIDYAPLTEYYSTRSVEVVVNLVE